MQHPPRMCAVDDALKAASAEEAQGDPVHFLGQASCHLVGDGNVGRRPFLPRRDLGIHAEPPNRHQRGL